MATLSAFWFALFLSLVLLLAVADCRRRRLFSPPNPTPPTLTVNSPLQFSFGADAITAIKPTSDTRIKFTLDIKSASSCWIARERPMSYSSSRCSVNVNWMTVDVPMSKYLELPSVASRSTDTGYEYDVAVDLRAFTTLLPNDDRTSGSDFQRLLRFGENTIKFRNCFPAVTCSRGQFCSTAQSSRESFFSDPYYYGEPMSEFSFKVTITGDPCEKAKEDESVSPCLRKEYGTCAPDIRGTLSAYCKCSGTRTGVRCEQPADPNTVLLSKPNPNYGDELSTLTTTSLQLPSPRNYARVKRTQTENGLVVGWTMVLSSKEKEVSLPLEDVFDPLKGGWSIVEDATIKPGNPFPCDWEDPHRDLTMKSCNAALYLSKCGVACAKDYVLNLSGSPEYRSKSVVSSLEVVCAGNQQFVTAAPGSKPGTRSRPLTAVELKCVHAKHDFCSWPGFGADCDRVAVGGSCAPRCSNPLHEMYFKGKNDLDWTFVTEEKLKEFSVTCPARPSERISVECRPRKCKWWGPQYEEVDIGDSRVPECANDEYLVLDKAVVSTSPYLSMKCQANGFFEPFYECQAACKWEDANRLIGGSCEKVAPFHTCTPQCETGFYVAFDEKQRKGTKTGEVQCRHDRLRPEPTCQPRLCNLDMSTHEEFPCKDVKSGETCTAKADKICPSDLIAVNTRVQPYEELSSQSVVAFECHDSQQSETKGEFSEKVDSEVKGVRANVKCLAPSDCQLPMFASHSKVARSLCAHGATCSLYCAKDKRVAARLVKALDVKSADLTCRFGQLFYGEIEVDEFDFCEDMPMCEWNSGDDITQVPSGGSIDLACSEPYTLWPAPKNPNVQQSATCDVNGDLKLTGTKTPAPKCVACHVAKSLRSKILSLLSGTCATFTGECVLECRAGKEPMLSDLPGLVILECDLSSNPPTTIYKLSPFLAPAALQDVEEQFSCQYRPKVRLEKCSRLQTDSDGVVWCLKGGSVYGLLPERLKTLSSPDLLIKTSDCDKMNTFSVFGTTERWTSDVACALSDKQNVHFGISFGIEHEYSSFSLDAGLGVDLGYDTKIAVTPAEHPSLNIPLMSLTTDHHIDADGVKTNAFEMVFAPMPPSALGDFQTAYRTFLSALDKNVGKPVVDAIEAYNQLITDRNWAVVPSDLVKKTTSIVVKKDTRPSEFDLNNTQVNYDLPFCAIGTDDFLDLFDNQQLKQRYKQVRKAADSWLNKIAPVWSKLNTGFDFCYAQAWLRQFLFHVAVTSIPDKKRAMDAPDILPRLVARSQKNEYDQLLKTPLNMILATFPPWTRAFLLSFVTNENAFADMMRVAQLDTLIVATESSRSNIEATRHNLNSLRVNVVGCLTAMRDYDSGFSVNSEYHACSTLTGKSILPFAIARDFEVELGVVVESRLDGAIDGVTKKSVQSKLSSFVHGYSKQTADQNPLKQLWETSHFFVEEAAEEEEEEVVSKESL